jgi:hypothetical protein
MFSRRQNRGSERRGEKLDRAAPKPKLKKQLHHQPGKNAKIKTLEKEKTQWDFNQSP